MDIIPLMLSTYINLLILENYSKSPFFYSMQLQQWANATWSDM